MAFHRGARPLFKSLVPYIDGYCFFPYGSGQMLSSPPLTLAIPFPSHSCRRTQSSYFGSLHAKHSPAHKVWQRMPQGGGGVSKILDTMRGYRNPPPFSDIASGGGGGLRWFSDACMPTHHCQTLHVGCSPFLQPKFCCPFLPCILPHSAPCFTSRESSNCHCHCRHQGCGY